MASGNTPRRTTLFGVNPDIKGPWDGRTTVADIAARDALADAVVYCGLEVFVEDESKFYVLISEGPRVWRERQVANEDDEHIADAVNDAFIDDSQEYFATVTRAQFNTIRDEHTADPTSHPNHLTTTYRILDDTHARSAGATDDQFDTLQDLAEFIETNPGTIRTALEVRSTSDNIPQDRITGLDDSFDAKQNLITTENQLGWEFISGTPTTVAGYGITDVASQSDIDAKQDIINADNRLNYNFLSNVPITLGSLSAPGTTSNQTLIPKVDSDGNWALSVDLVGDSSFDGSYSSLTGLPNTISDTDLTDAEQQLARANIGAGTSDFSGSYTDLDNKPRTILDGSSFSPSQQAEARMSIGAGTSSFSGSYNDLADVPTIDALTPDDRSKLDFITITTAHNIDTLATTVTLLGERNVLSDADQDKLNHITVAEDIDLDNIRTVTDATAANDTQVLTANADGTYGWADTLMLDSFTEVDGSVTTFTGEVQGRFSTDLGRLRVDGDDFEMIAVDDTFTIAGSSTVHTVSTVDLTDSYNDITFTPDLGSTPAFDALLTFTRTILASITSDRQVILSADGLEFADGTQLTSAPVELTIDTNQYISDFTAETNTRYTGSVRNLSNSNRNVIVSLPETPANGDRIVFDDILATGSNSQGTRRLRFLEGSTLRFSLEGQHGSIEFVSQQSNWTIARYHPSTSNNSGYYDTDLQFANTSSIRFPEDHDIGVASVGSAGITFSDGTTLTTAATGVVFTDVEDIDDVPATPSRGDEIYINSATDVDTRPVFHADPIFTGRQQVMSSSGNAVVANVFATTGTNPTGTNLVDQTTVNPHGDMYDGSVSAPAAERFNFQMRGDGGDANEGFAMPTTDGDANSRLETVPQLGEDTYQTAGGAFAGWVWLVHPTDRRRYFLLGTIDGTATAGNGNRSRIQFTRQNDLGNGWNTVDNRLDPDVRAYGNAEFGWSDGWEIWTTDADIAILPDAVTYNSGSVYKRLNTTPGDNDTGAWIEQ